MSLKPKKFSEMKRDEKELKIKMEKKKKESLRELPPYTYIVSEGTKTEPNYINALAEEVNDKYFDMSSGKRIMVKGTGKNTSDLLEYARKQVEKEMPQASVVWLMYDKDDFPPDKFDNTQYSAEKKSDGKRKYRVAWSNECIELWFLLHFQDLTVNVGRGQYQKDLYRYCNYQKNMKNIYEILKDKTNLAIDRARRQHEGYGNVAPSKMCPATLVYLLVEELKSYL